MLHSSAIAGACAGLVSSVVTCPLDVVKTRLQAQEGRRRPQPPSLTSVSNPDSLKLDTSPRYLGLRDTLRKIWTDDGIRGFYRGLGPTIFGYLPTWAIYFTVYDSSKTAFSSSSSFFLTSSNDFLNHILSAMTAGAASTICTSPLWVVKTRFMLQSARDTANSVRPYRHTGDAFVQIFKSEGVRGFYKGLLPSLFGVSHVAVQFPLYELFKGIARDRLHGQGGEVGGEEGGELEASTILLCSSTAKMIASVTTYPHEVLRTRLQMQPRNQAQVQSTMASNGVIVASPSSTASSIASNRAKTASASLSSNATTSQVSSTCTSSTPLPSAAAAGGTKSKIGSITTGNNNRSGVSAAVTGGGSANVGGTRYTGVIQACKTIAREEGIRGFYKGMAVNLIRTVPSSALTILTYELIMQHFSQHDSSS
ncbi:related to YIA6 - Pvruvate transporter of the mitochondrial inner membrane [Melanopsichium pennsylvanicum]|uniref:Related to YIA6 - Pvruvate transporter of the mitochondrial inner membrane n=2 Tax=Melanopsichium pennsylvanicum TaxID=63383 RepID=A0AAJ4XIZ5_9BASI|nr:related to YIA6-Pvruvate transporter of the mitochondrial inner membrane [Melanopsichium pennsylvanicum 4]SNX83405.1 related to YIA6 - Pvruvate transporter of the mitochondrial inner membrane [Melanopsichium pennsylvanicum]